MHDERLAVVGEIVRELLPGAAYRVTRVAEGVSTWVYRVENDDECLYIRILPEENASFAPEVAVHRALRAAGVRVPDVLFWADRHPALDRSLMLTPAIAGRDLRCYRSSAARSIVRQAGRDLALINQIAVAGYGWLRRYPPAVGSLVGEYPSLAAWLHSDVLPMIEPLHASGALDQQDIQALEICLARAETLFGDAAQAYLAHGDFDLTHIFANNDTYTGIIDFGEIRGTYALYDLGHFAIEDPDLLPDLLAGYADVSRLPPDQFMRIALATLLVAARRAGRMFARRGTIHPPDIVAIQRALRSLQRST